MDWVNCNSCFVQPQTGGGRKFHLTTCGHIYCDSCVIERTKDNCYMCNQKCTTFQLSNQMSSDIDIYFHDFSDIMKQYRKGLLEVFDQKLAKLDKVHAFQQSHRLHLKKYLESVAMKQKDIEDKMKYLIDRNQKLEEELNYVKGENFNLNETISNLKTAQIQNDVNKFTFNDDPPPLNMNMKPIMSTTNTNNIFNGFRDTYESFNKPLDSFQSQKQSFQTLPTNRRESSNSSTCNIRSLFNEPSNHSIHSVQSKMSSSNHNASKYFNNTQRSNTSNTTQNNEPYLKNISTQSFQDILKSLKRK